MLIGYPRSMVFGAACLATLLSNGCGGGSQGQEPAGPSPVAVALFPKAVIVPRNNRQPFAATVSGTTHSSVAWTVNAIPNGNTSVGTITGSGTSVDYTAPATDDTFTVVATSLADTSKSSASMITVRDGCAPAPSSPSVLNVRNPPYSATGDGLTDDSGAIQRAINDIAAGGTVHIPSGTYLIDAVASSIRLKSNMTLRLETGAILQAKPNNATNYKILYISGATQVIVTGGGTLQGERASHTGTTGEHGHGLTISNSHQVVVENITARDCWGDGFYVGSNSTNVTLCGVVANNNRRAGISITSVNGLVIRGSSFLNTNGTLPQCGLNIEPNPGEIVHDVQILGSTFEGNAGRGLSSGVPCAHSATVTSVVIDGNTVRRNLINGIEISKCSGTRITNNTVTDNQGAGILLRGCGTDISMGANGRVPGSGVGAAEK